MVNVAQEKEISSQSICNTTLTTKRLSLLRRACVVHPPDTFCPHLQISPCVVHALSITVQTTTHLAIGDIWATLDFLNKPSQCRSFMCKVQRIRVAPSKPQRWSDQVYQVCVSINPEYRAGLSSILLPVFWTDLVENVREIEEHAHLKSPICSIVGIVVYIVASSVLKLDSNTDLVYLSTVMSSSLQIEQPVHVDANICGVSGASECHLD